MTDLATVEVIYRNNLGEEVEFDRFGPLYLQSYEGFGSPENEISSQKIFGKSGQRKTSSSLSYRDLTLKVAVKGESYDDLKGKEHEIMQVLNPDKAGTVLIRLADNLYSIDCEILKGYEANESGSGSSASTSTLQFRALDPEWRDENARNRAIILSSSERKMKFPLSIHTDFVFGTIVPGQILALQNKGDFAVGFELSIRCMATVTNPKILNVLTQEYFEWEGTFAGDTNLFLSTVHGAKKTWYQNDDDTEQINAMSMRKLGSTFFKLDNLVDNNLVVQAESGTEHLISTITFTPLLIGV